MIRKSFVGFAGAVVVAAVFAQTFAGAQGAVPATTPTQQPMTGNAEEAKPPAGTVMSVRIPKAVMADGKPLPAGTYTIRVTDSGPTPAVGQTAAEMRWVEFVQGGQVKGREVGTIKSTTEARRIAKQGLPGVGAARIQTLYGNDYLRVWINKGGTNYLVHLPNS